jgi:hypothetical protein
MTPKEKVDQLVDEFYNFVFNPEGYHDEMLDDTINCCDKVADEVIKEINELERLTFWKQVKDELWQRRKKK